MGCFVKLMIQVCGKWDHKRKRQNRFLCVCLVHVLSSWLASFVKRMKHLNHIEVHWTYSSIFICSWSTLCTPTHRSTLCCVFYNPSWWHIESIKRIFLCTINVLIWCYEPVIFQPIILQCERVNAFLMQFYAKIHFEDINRSLALSSSLSKDSSSQNS